MADTTNVSFTAQYTTVSAWSGILEITLTNNTGATLNGPLEISFDMPETVTPSTNTGLDVENSGTSTTHVVGQLADNLLPVADGESVTFRVGIGSSTGNLSANALPTAYYVNGVLAGEGGGGAPDTTAPDAPGGLVSTGTTSSSIDLSWNAASDNVGVAGYIVTYSGPSGTQTKRVTGTTTTLDGLSADTTYTISLQAYDAAGNVSASSDSISVITQAVATDTTPPDVPENLRLISVTQDSVALAWTASTDDESGVKNYVVSYASPGAASQSVTVTGPSATISGLEPNTSYTFSVSAVDNAGNQSANSASLTTTTLGEPADTTAPSVPANVRVTGTTQSSVSLAWNAATDDTGVDHYVVSYSTAAGTARTVTVNSPSATISGLTPETAYTFSVTAVDAAGNESASSATVSATTAAPATGGHTVEYAPYTDVTLFAKWATTPPGLTTDFVKDAIALGVRKFHLAFLVQGSSAGRSPVWGSDSFPLESIAPLVDLINEAGGEPIFAFGGLSGVDFSTTWSVDELAALYIRVATDYGVRTIDLDFETPGNYNVDVAYPAFIKAREALPYLELCLTLPVFPSGLVEGRGLKVVQDAAAYGLQPYVNIMAMDYGPDNTSGDMGDDAIQAVVSTKDQLKAIWGYTDAEAYAKVGVTPMFGHNDVDPEVFELDDAVDLAAFAKENNLYMVSGWALTRDFAPGTTDANGNQHTQDKATSTLIPGLEDYGFSKTILNELAAPSTPDTTAPTVPENVQVTKVSHYSASLAWDASTDDRRVHHYVVTYTSPDSAPQTVTVTSPSANITGLSAETTYTFRVSAVDAAGNASASSAAVTATTSAAPVGGGTDATSFAPYVDVTIFANWVTSPPSINTTFIREAIALGVTKFHLAFLVSDTTNPTNPVWGTNSFPLASIGPVVDMINEAGGEPIFAFGGFSGVDFSTTWSVDDLAALYVQIANDYGVKVIDLDFETIGNYNYNVAFPAFIKARQSLPELEIGLTLPVSTVGLSAEGVSMLNAAAALGLNPYVNIMAMDYGAAYAGDMGDYAISAIDGTKDQIKAAYGISDEEAYAKIGVTPMIGVNDVSVEIFTLEDAAQVAAYAKLKGLHEVSEWSLGRDFAPGTTDSSGNYHSELSTSTQIAGQENYAFTKTFQNGIS